MARARELFRGDVEPYPIMDLVLSRPVEGNRRIDVGCVRVYALTSLQLDSKGRADAHVSSAWRQVAG